MKNKKTIKFQIENSTDYLNIIDMFIKLNNNLPCYAYLSFKTSVNMGLITKDNIKICKENIYFGKAYGIDHYKAEFLPENFIILTSNSSRLMNNNEKEYIFGLHISQNYN